LRERDNDRKRAEYAAKQTALGKTVGETRLGRPADPKRQAMRAARRERREQREQALREREEREERDRLLEHKCGIKLVLTRRGGINVDAYYNVPLGVKPPDWMLSPVYTGWEWRVYSGRDFVPMKKGPRRDKTSPADGCLAGGMSKTPSRCARPQPSKRPCSPRREREHDPAPFAWLHDSWDVEKMRTSTR